MARGARSTRVKLPTLKGSRILAPDEIRVMNSEGKIGQKTKQTKYAVKV
jgi:hypothetical protein